MKFIGSLLIFSLFMISCGGNDNASDNYNAGESTSIQDAGNANTANSGERITLDNVEVPPPSVEPAQNAQGVWHYICPNGCEGGAAGALTCGGCGATMVHNQAYHNTGDAPAGNQDGQVMPSTPPPPPPTAEPAQNANGVWHYVCAKGCAGGAGAAGPCPTCGEPLQHNSQYHQ